MSSTTAATSASASGPPRAIPQADIVEPLRPFVIAVTRKESVTVERKAAFARAGAWSAL
jgi:hypothetical protein